MEYPDYLLYVSQDEMKWRSTQAQLKKQHEILAKCDSTKVTEIDGELKAVMDIEVYQFLINYLKRNTFGE